MLHRLGSHIRSQWMGALALFLVLTGGIAYAAETIGSADIINESILSEDVKNAQVRSADIGNNQVLSADVRDDTLANGGLTGADIADNSGVDTCPNGTTRLGDVCVRAATVNVAYPSAIVHCANLELRVPTLGEALSLAVNYDIPDMEDNEFFWTDESDGTGGTAANEPDAAYRVTDFGTYSTSNGNADAVCVATPTN